MTTANNELIREVAGLLVEAPNLEVSPDDIDPQAPLYGDGLGLDSIVILEVSLVVSKKYGVQLRAEPLHDSAFSRLRSRIALLVTRAWAHPATGRHIFDGFLPTVGSYGYSTMFFFWAGCTVIYFITAAFFLPETKGKTLEEIEEHFEGKKGKAA